MGGGVVYIFCEAYHFVLHRRLYLWCLSPRSELPDLLRWDSWSESEESEGGKQRQVRGKIRIQNFR